MNLNGASFKGTVDIGDLVSKCERETMELNRFITLASLKGTAYPQIENLSLAAAALLALLPQVASFLMLLGQSVNPDAGEKLIEEYRRRKEPVSCRRGFGKNGREERDERH